MLQLLQDLESGQTVVAQIPAPVATPGRLLVRVRASAVSAGTERMLAGFAAKGWLGKAAARPDLVRQVLTKAARDGVTAAWEAVQGRLVQPVSLGYSCAGVVEALGPGVEGFRVGDRVACAGAGYANHAEFVSVPANLCVLLPATEPPSFEEAAFTTLGAIALHGLRCGDSRLGESVAVVGLGILGQLALQLAAAAGCRPFGTDLDGARVDLARSLGASASLRPEAVDACLRETDGRGADLVLICADATSDDPISLAGDLARDRATVVVVGAVGLAVPRATYYRKELRLIVSRSYGPGRYDPVYEEGGVDYPVSYVRWTERRNMEATVRLLAERRLHIAPLVTHRFPIEEGARAYELITGKEPEPYLGIVLTFGAEAPVTRTVESRPAVVGAGAPAIGVLGAGHYAGSVLLPIIAASRAELAGIASPSGLRAQAFARKFGFRFSASENDKVLDDTRTGAVVVVTRHDLHAQQVIDALSRGKHVFVEKPLCLDDDELARIIEARRVAGDRLVEVGYNRRHAPYTRALLEFFSGIAAPRTVAIRVNAGPLPPDDWLLDPKVGGGRLLGEGCHFIDWAGRVVGESAAEADCRPLGRLPGEQDWVLHLRYPGGSVAEIIYLSQGATTLGKERYEVHSGGRSAVLEDFRTLRLYAAGRRLSRRSWLRADKGQRAQWAAFLSAVRGEGPPPTPWEDTVGTMRTVFAARASLRHGRAIEVQE